LPVSATERFVPALSIVIPDRRIETGRSRKRCYRSRRDHDLLDRIITGICDIEVCPVARYTIRIMETGRSRKRCHISRAIDLSDRVIISIRNIEVCSIARYAPGLLKLAVVPSR
jgi:hypothetical protein